LQTIKKENLLENVKAVESYLYNELENIASGEHGKIRNIRGKGNLIAFDCEFRDKIDLHQILRTKGINTSNSF
jgi:4-aminobutyrate aminotransferase-like enzyme